MSVFLNMTVSPKAERQRFLWEINRFGEVVIHWMNEDGTLGSFCACRRLKEMLDAILASDRNNLYEIDSVERAAALQRHWPQWQGFTSWRSVLDFLKAPGRLKNGKRDVAQREAHQRVNQWPTTLFIAWTWNPERQRHEPQLTPAALAWDLEFAPKEAPTTP